MVVYIDVVFLENLILDFIILLATGIIYNGNFKIWRLLLASIVGSAFIVIDFIIELNGVFELVLKMVMSFVMIAISFGVKSKKSFLKHLVVFYLTSITFGGASFMFLFWVNPKEIIYKAGHFFGLYPVKMAFIGGIFGFFLIVGVQKMLKRKFMKFCDLAIVYHGKEIKMKALVDTREFVKREYFKFACCDCRKKGVKWFCG